MVASIIGNPALSSPVPSTTPTSAAKNLTAGQREQLSIAVLAGMPMRQLAEEIGVSRKFLANQRDIAQDALDQAFRDDPPDQKVLFHLPVTKLWIQRFVLATALVGHASDRDVMELARTLLGYPISLGTVHNIMHAAADCAKALNAQEDLSGIAVGALDEIYQCDKPTLVGVDLQSTYCFLLEAERCCDGETWGLHLLELMARHLNLQMAIADGGKGLRSGLELAGCKFPCQYDVFHALRMFRDVVQYAENRAYSAMKRVEQFKRRKDRTGRRAAPSPAELAQAQLDVERTISLADDLNLLYQWMRLDVLGRSGPDPQTRRELFDFVVEQLGARLGLCKHRLAPLIKTLSNHRDLLLIFAEALQRRLEAIAVELAVSVEDVQDVFMLQGLDRNQSWYWRRRSELMGRLGERYHAVAEAVAETLSQTHRASSMVENLNGRLRGYLSLWRGSNQPYLELLRFFLNHRPYARSAHPERVGKSPWELLSGQRHPCWLDMLQTPASAN